MTPTIIRPHSKRLSDKFLKDNLFSLKLYNNTLLSEIFIQQVSQAVTGQTQLLVD